MTFRRCVYHLQMLWFIKTEIWCEDVYWSFYKEMPCASQASTDFSEVFSSLAVSLQFCYWQHRAAAFLKASEQISNKWFAFLNIAAPMTKNVPKASFS